MNLFLIILGVVLILLGAYGCIKDRLIEEDMKALKGNAAWLEAEKRLSRMV